MRSAADSSRRADLIAWGLLAAAMCASTAWLMSSGRDLIFSGDEIFYYARFVEDSGVVAPGGGVEYFLAPHNGHLVLLGKLIYRGLFLTVGADYAVFRAVEIVTVLACVGLFFVLARRRVGPWAALIPSVLLLFLGYAAESLLWPFNLHTSLSLAFGLGSMLTLERDDRRGDVATCILLVLSVATVEVGLAFVVGIGLSVLSRPDRWRRAWIVLIPLAIFAVWWLWAHQFGHSNFALGNVRLIPITVANALAAVVGSIFGLNPTGAEIPSNQTTVVASGTLLAALGVAGLIFRVTRGRVPMTLWISLAVVLAYWLQIAMGGRSPDVSRYIFVGAVMVLLIAADALRGVRLPWPALVGAACVAGLAIAPNIAKLDDWRRPETAISKATQAEYAMLELTRGRVDPGYMPGADPDVIAAGGTVFAPLAAGEYFRASEEFGSLASSLERIRDEALWLQGVADTTLIGALEVELLATDPPLDPGACSASRDGAPGRPVFFELPRGGALLGSQAGRSVEVAVSRFGGDGGGVSLGALEAGDWGRIAVTADDTPDPWLIFVDGPVYVCGVATS